MQLDREITETMFNVTSKEDVKAIFDSGKDLKTCSRMALDRALLTVFGRKCHGTKELAIKMLEGCLTGVEVPDVNDSGMSYYEASEQLGISPEERSEMITKRCEELVSSMKSYYTYVSVLKKDPQLKSLGASDDEIAFSVLDSEVAICGKGVESGKTYLMKREQQYIDIATKEGDILYFKK